MRLKQTSIRILLAIVLLYSWNAQAQSKKDLSNYAYAKQLLEGNKYVQAHTVLEEIVSDGESNHLYTNASYLQGLLKYKQGQTQAAREQLFKITQQFPDWKGNQEVYFLLATIDFEWEMPEQALENLQKIDKSTLLKDVYYLKKAAFDNYGIAQLKKIRTQLSEDEALDRVLLGKLYKEGDREYEKALIEELEAKYNPNAQVQLEKSLFKDTYRVGIFMPFNYTRINTNNPQASFILDLYEGMKLAQHELNQSGSKIELYTFDTERDSTTTATILSDPEVAKLDLIVGPIYPENIRVVSQFAQQNSIPMVNPIREEPWITEDNPMSFLFSTSLNGQATFAAEYAFRELKSVQSYIVLGNKRRDIEMADAYKARMEELGGSVLNYVQFSYDEDSYKNLMKELRGIIRQSNPHVFVTSRDLTVANTLISALQALDANVTIIAPQRWMERPQLSFSRMESANVHFYHPLKYHENSDEALVFQKMYLDKANIYPSKYAYIGYGALQYFGKALQKYGANFTKSLSQQDAQDIQIPIFDTPNYQYNRYNSQISISGFKNSKFQTLYSQQNP